MNIKEPLVSVIIPMYNAREYIGEALESILKQTYTNMEIIILDDASTDDSVNVVKKYKDDRIKILRNAENLKQSKTRNKLLEVSRGKYIANMDADDISKFDRIEKQVKYMEMHPNIDICGTNAVVVGKKILKCINNPVDDADIKEMLNYADALAHPTVMFRRSAIKEMDLKYDINFRYAQDYKFWCDAKDKGACFHNIPEYLFKYRMSNTNISGKHAYEQRKFADKIVEENINRLHGDGMVLNTLIKTIGTLEDFETDIKRIKDYIDRNTNDKKRRLWINILKVISGRYSVYGFTALVSYLKLCRLNIFSIWFVKYICKCCVRYDSLNCRNNIEV